MRRTLLVTLVLALCAVAPRAFAVQVTLVDQTVNHTEAGGAFVSAGVPAGTPADFTAPDDFANGTLHHRIEVTNIPAGANTTTYKICLVQDANDPNLQACSANALSFDAVGTYEAMQDLTSFDQYANIDWSAGLVDIVLVAMDANGVPVDSSENTWVGSPDYSLYYPLEATYQAVLVANGDAFEGFPGDSANQVETPSFSPGAGSFEGSVNVRIESATADAAIYYTTDGSDPDDSSTLYDGNVITIDQTTTLRAIAYADGMDPSDVAEATYTIVPPGDAGLRGRYYNGTEFGELVTTRTDLQLEFFWDGEPPTPDISGGQFSIIWTGQIIPRYSGTYTIKTVNDDGVRVWVADQLLIDDWNNHGPEERTGTIQVQADEAYPIWIEYFNGGGPGTMELYWSSDEQAEEIIPATRMIPELPGGAAASVSLLGGTDQEVQETSTEPVRFQLRRRGDIDASISVALTLGGDAEAGSDFQEIPLTVDLAPGELTRTIELLPIDDEEVEGDEEVTLSIAEGEDYVLSEPTSAAVVIKDNDLDHYTISGRIEYSGEEQGNIVVEAFTETSQLFEVRRQILEAPGDFELDAIEPGDYFVVAFVDTNGNEMLDADELWGTHQNEEFEQASVTVPPSASEIVIDLDVPPGEDPELSEEGGCCATLAGGRGATPTWLLVALSALVCLVRRRRA